jgi:hypothetical protein
MKTVWVKVDCRPGCEDPDGAAGLWQVTLREELPVGHAVGAALDVFHRGVTIGVLDDFDIRVLDPGSRQEICEAEDYKQGSGCDGEVELVGEDGTHLGPSP